MRRGNYVKKKEELFSTKQHVNQVLLPQYNALRDPFLVGYFDNPMLKRHLKETGVLKRKKRFSVKAGRQTQEKNKEFTQGYRTSRPKGGKKYKSLSKSVNTNPVKLPDIEQQERGPSSSATHRLKRLYGSKDKQREAESEELK